MIKLTEERIKKTLDRLGIDIEREDGNNYIFKCVNPEHNDSDPSLSLHKTKGIWNCWSCGATGNIFTLVSLKKNCSLRKSIKYVHKGLKLTNDRLEDLKQRLQMITDMDYNDNNKPPKVFKLPYGFKKINKVQFAYHRTEDDYEKRLNRFVEYLMKRKIDIRIASRMKIGYLEKLDKNEKRYMMETAIGKKRTNRYFRYLHRIVIPIYQNGKCRGVIGRIISNRRKGVYYSDRRYLYDYKMDMKKILYNIDNLKKEESCILVEGTLDVLKGEGYGLKKKRFIGILGAHISDYHIKLLSNKGIKKVWLAFDNDKGGRRIVKEYARELFEHFEVYVVRLPEGEDVGSCSKKIFMKCLKKAKKVVSRPFLKKINRMKKKIL